MISIFLLAQGYKTAIYSNVNTLQSPIFPMRFHFSWMHSVLVLQDLDLLGGSFSKPYFSRDKQCIMVLLLCPRFEAVVVINSELSVVLLRPITNPHLHLGSAVMHYSILLINNSHCIQLGEGRDGECGPKQMLKPTVAGSYTHKKAKAINEKTLEGELDHLG